jgi:hypothetical protein
MECDICSTPGHGTVVRAHQMSSAVRKGFNPFREPGLMPPWMLSAIDPGYPDRWAQSATNGDTSHSDWNVCAKCYGRLNRYLDPGA